MEQLVKYWWVCWFYFKGFVKSPRLLPKLQPYGFSKESIRLFLRYLTNCTRGIKIESTLDHSDWTNIVKGVPQGSILGPLLFNIFINYLFSAKCEICYFADDNSLYSCGMNLDNMFTNLIQDM